MSQQGNYTSQLATLHREIEEENRKLRELEKKRDDERRKHEENSRENVNRIRQAYIQPNSAQMITDLTREMQMVNSSYVTEITNLHGQIQSCERKILQKRSECIRLFQN